MYDPIRGTPRNRRSIRRKQFFRSLLSATRTTPVNTRTRLQARGAVGLFALGPILKTLLTRM
jgi:hypothetical protein